MVEEYEKALSCLSSLISRRTRAHGSNKGDRFDLMFDYLKILDLEDAVSQLKIIHVAGTKGKGSTCTFTESILRCCGFRTGLFTSPHLIDIRERFRLDGVEVSLKKFLEHFWWCWNRLQVFSAMLFRILYFLYGIDAVLLPEKTDDNLPMPNFFRFLTLLAFRLFSVEQVDVAIMEVGLGGKFDPTNAVHAPIVCGISSLGYDHMEILGHTLGEIAGEKAGIFKKGVLAYTVHQPEEAMKALEDKASLLGIPLQVVSPSDRGLLKNQHLGLDGEHQLTNAALAIALSSYWLKATGNLKDLHLNQNTLPGPFIRGLSEANLEGRAQVVPDPLMQQQNNNGGLIFYLDGAHSPESLEVCGKWFSFAIRGGRLLEEQPNENQSGRGGGCSDACKEGSLQILLFNCMSVRDPKLLLPRLVNVCAQNGVNFHQAIFVPNQSTLSMASSHAATPTDPEQVDLSWQVTLQREWDNLHHTDKGSGSLVLASLPLAIEWLRERAQKSRSIQFQVLVTGSLHLVGDVLRLIE